MAGHGPAGGAPGAAVVLGAALGSTLLSRLDGRARAARRPDDRLRHRRGGALVARPAVIVAVASDPARRHAADRLRQQLEPAVALRGGRPFPVARRASAIGIVVWGATFGAVIGPNLIGLAGGLGDPRPAAARGRLPAADRLRRARGDPVVLDAPAGPVRLADQTASAPTTGRDRGLAPGGRWAAQRRRSRWVA